MYKRIDFVDFIFFYNDCVCRIIVWTVMGNKFEKESYQSEIWKSIVIESLLARSNITYLR